MAARVRAFDWSLTPLGPMDRWPQSLRTAVSICLGSRFPMMLWWGPELINIYNDAFISVLGGWHPRALGMSGREVWADTWPVIGPQVAKVMEEGGSTLNERVRLVYTRHGFPEETWFTWSFGPIHDEGGRVGGLFNTCHEDTQQVVAERERERLATQRQLALDAARLGWWHYDPATKVASFDRRYAEIFGVCGQQAPNEEILKRLHPEDLAGVWAKVEAALDPADPKPYSAEYRIILEDGSVRWVEAHGTPAFGGEGEDRRAISFVGTVADVTDRKRAEDQVRRSHDTFYYLIQNNPFGVYVVDADFRLRQVSLGSQKVFANVPRPLLGRDFAEVLRAVWAEPFATETIGRFRHTLETGEPYAAPGTVERRQGMDAVEAYDWRIERVTLPDGRFGVVCFFYDLSERQRWEAALAEARRKLDSALIAGEVGTFQWDVLADRLWGDQNFAKIFGIGVDATGAAPIADYLAAIHPDDRGPVVERVRLAVDTGCDYEAEYRIVTTDQRRWVIARGKVERDGAGRAVRFPGVVLDVTERKQAEQLLAAQGRALELLAAGSPLRDILGTLTNAVEEQSGRKAVASILLVGPDGCSLHTGAAPNLPAEYNAALDGIKAAQGVGTCADAAARNEVVCTPDLAAAESWRGLAHLPLALGLKAAWSMPICATDGRVLGTFGTYFRECRGPSERERRVVEGLCRVAALAVERRRAEAALRESEGRLAAILDNTPAVVYVVDTQNRFQFINRRWEPVFGLTNERVVGRSIYDFFPRDVAEQFAANNLRVAEARASVEAEEVVPHADGPRTYISVKVPLFDGGGNVYAVCGISADISERKRAEGRDRLLVALDDAVRSLRDPDEVTAIGARLLGEHLGADRCAYADVEADEDTFNLTGDHTREGVPSIVGRYRFADFGAEVLRLMRENKPYVVEDVDAHRPAVGDLSYYRQTMIRAVVCVPLHKAGRFVAAMAVHQRTPRRWLPEEVELVQAVAARCWESIERGRVLRALRDSEGRFRKLADAMPQIVWVTRADGYHEYYNRRWYEFTGVPEGSTDGEGWNALFHPDDRERAWAAWRHSLSTGEPYEIEYRLRHRDGEYRWTLGRALPVRNERGEVERWFGTCTDIDAMKRLTAEREQLLESERALRGEAESASRAKDKFLAVLSHELRTPLSPVVMTIPAMELDPEMPFKFREDLAMVRRNIDLEVKLIDDLLDLSRVTSGKLRLQMQPVRVHELLRHVVQSSAMETAGKRLHVRHELTAENDLLSGDPARLQQVFWNLVRNAVKFTPEGGTITVRTRNADRTDGPGGKLLVEVQDTGVGIRPDVLPRIFEAFEQGELRMTRQFGGMGLGLAIARAVVEMHGGTVRAASDGPGRGATFTVELTTSQGAGTPEAHASPVPAPGRRRAGSRVLLVEDHPDTSRAMEKLLKRAGYEVTAAHSVASALQIAAAEPFDIVVSDIGLPDATGYELMEQIRDRHGIKGIALSGYGMEDDMRKSREAGFADHVIKPVTVTQLEAAIERVLKARQGG